MFDVTGKKGADAGWAGIMAGKWYGIWMNLGTKFRWKKIYRHICTEMGQSQWDSEAGNECRDPRESESTPVNGRGQEGKMRGEEEVMDNSQVPLTKVEHERGIGWGWVGVRKIVYLLVEVLNVKSLWSELSYIFGRIYVGRKDEVNGCGCNCSK